MNNGKSKEYSFSQINRFILLTFFFIINLVYVSKLLGINLYIDLSIYLYFSGFISFLLFLLKKAKKYTRIVFFNLSIFLISTTVLSRFIGLIVLPPLVKLPINRKFFNIDGLRMEHIKYGMIYLFSYITIYLIGMYIGTIGSNKFLIEERWQINQFKTPFFKTRGIIFIITGVILFSTTILLLHFGWEMGEKWEHGWIVRLIPTSLFYNLSTFLLIYYFVFLKRKERYLIICIILFFSFFSLLQGSRSGLYNLVILLLTISLVIKGDFRIERKNIFFIIALTAIFGPLIWVFGTAQRYNIPIVQAFSNESDLLFLAIKISGRLGSAVDDFILAINNFLDPYAIQQYLTLKNVIGSALNGFLPGTLIHIPINNLGNLWNTLFWEEPLGHRIHGEDWYIFAQFYFLFGTFFSFIAILLMGVIFSYISTLILSKKNFFYSFFCMQLSISFIFSVLSGSNFDAILMDLLYSFSYNIFLLLFVTFLSIALTPTKKNSNQRYGPL
jgi:hypothetical protein